jgi:hypothetical protein
MRASFIFFLASLGLVSCRKEIPFDDDFTEPMLSVNGAIHKDSIISVHIGRSYGMLDSDELQVVNNAVVELLDNSGNLVEILQYDQNGMYFSPSGFKPAPSTAYTVRVSHPTLPTASATAVIPAASIAVFTDTARVVYNGEADMLRFSFTVTDQPGEQFYMLEIYNESYYLDWNNDTIWYEYLEGFYRTSPVLENSGDYDSKAFFTDQLFEGGSQRIDVVLYYYPEYGNKLRARLTSLSKDLYLFYKSASLYEQATGNPFAQPVQVYSNINQGYGVFGGYDAIWVAW